MRSEQSPSIFVSGAFVSYYYQSNVVHGPFDVKLQFNASANNLVYGKGSDDIGLYIIQGNYSPRTLRMSLTKTYQTGTGNPRLNFGHSVTIQVEWNDYDQQFEGEFYVKINGKMTKGQYTITPKYLIDGSIYYIESQV